MLNPTDRANAAGLRDRLNAILYPHEYRTSTQPITSAMSRKERNGYSITRAVHAMATGDYSKARFEREVSDEIQRTTGATPRGEKSFFIPNGMPFQVEGAPRSRMLSERSIYQVGTPAQGGNLVETQLLAADFIQVLRNAMVTADLGATLLTELTGNVNIPRQDTQTQTYWVGESAAPTESEAVFDQVQLRPHVVGAISKLSRLMLQQSTPAIEQMVREDMTQATALAVDSAALFGLGTSAQPTGIANTPGVGTVIAGVNGAPASFDLLVQLYATPLVANAPQDNLAFAINGKTKGYLATLKSSTGQYLWNPTQSIAAAVPGSLVGYRYAVSNQLPYMLSKGTSIGNCSAAIFGNWRELLIGEWGYSEIMVNPYDSTGFTTGDVSVRIFQTVDIGLRHPASFAVVSDLLTPGF